MKRFFPGAGVFTMVGALYTPGSGMTTSNGAAPRTFWPATGVAAFAALLQRTATNLGRAVLVLGRPRRARPPRIDAVPFVAAAATIAAIMASIYLLDAQASEWARHLPQWLTDPADEITNFGLSSRFLYPIGIILLVLAALMALSLPSMTRGLLAALFARFGFLFVAIGLPSLFDTVVKRMIGRARPYVGAHDNPLMFKPFIWLPEYASMPSGHATTATAAAVAIGAIWPRMRPVMWLYALIIMATRVVINVHHPSDVLGGALVGVIGALMVRRWFAARRLVFFADDLRAYPGPSWQRLKAVVPSLLSRPSPAAE